MTRTFHRIKKKIKHTHTHTNTHACERVSWLIRKIKALWIPRNVWKNLWSTTRRHIPDYLKIIDNTTVKNLNLSKPLHYVPPALTFRDSVFCSQCIYVFYVDLRTKSDYFPIQHLLTGLYNWDGVCLLRGRDWVFICNSTFCPHSVFMCFVWISEQTAIISLYIINWLIL